MRSRVVGVDRLVPLLDGTPVQYVNLDNAASTPPFVDVVEMLQEFLPYYSSVHRGTGFKSRLSTQCYEWARSTIGRFVNADPDQHTVIFGKNTTEAINKLSYRLPLGRERIVISTQLEHHSNDLPWRQRATVKHVRAKPCGRLDEHHFDELLERYAGRIALVAATGASNVSGYVQPIHRLARKSHAVGAPILIDCAQLAAHRPIDMRPQSELEHIDFVTLSAHKMYAPFGTGALVAPRSVFEGSAPEYSGGGTVAAVSMDEVIWADPPEREEAGSPNVVGAVAMAVAAGVLEEVGLACIEEHERELLVHALQTLGQVAGLTIYGETDLERASRDKLGVVPFNLDQVPHGLVAAILGYEGGIGVRSGCFCAHPYVVHLLGLDAAETARWRDRVASGDHSALPGMVRASIGCYNDRGDIERLAEMLHRITHRDYTGRYEEDRATGHYSPAGYEEPLREYASWL